MTELQFFEAIGGLDDDLVREADSRPSAQALPRWSLWAAGAAAAALVVTVGLSALGTPQADGRPIDLPAAIIGAVNDIIAPWPRETIKPYPGDPAIPEVPSSPFGVAVCWAYDATDKHLMVGACDYVFTATVISRDQVKYVEASRYSERIVYTQITVQVEDNIKGSLITESPIQLWFRNGPLPEDRVISSAPEGYRVSPAPGKTCVLLASAWEDDDLVIPCGVTVVSIGSREELEPEEFEAKRAELLAEYRQAYENEDTKWNNDGSICRYDVDYAEYKEGTESPEK
ncbi:MAG: hypothetical protein II794_05675 [Oscillospiraceae bacterium]|nr:hypothetical protein [Oscillospiraceae bacterium]